MIKKYLTIIFLIFSALTAEDFNKEHLQGPQRQIQVGTGYLKSNLKVEELQILKFEGFVGRGRTSFVTGNGWLIQLAAMYGWKNLKQDIDKLFLEATSYLDLDLCLGKQIHFNGWSMSPLIGLNWHKLKGTSQGKGNFIGKKWAVRRADYLCLFSPYVGIETEHHLSSQLKLNLKAKYHFMSIGKLGLRPNLKFDEIDLKSKEFNVKGLLCGPSFALDCEYNLNDFWSLNFGGSYSYQKIPKKFTEIETTFSTQEVHLAIGYAF